jgi:phytoene dehydrogenase-like protein
MAETYDVVVAGAGHNSLVCAAYLARAGLRVLVLEARANIGGNTATEELTLPGYKHDVACSAYVLLQSSPTIRNDELGLIGKYGLKFVKPDPVITMPFEDGSNLTMWLDMDRTVEEFNKFSKRDGEAYRRVIAEYDSIKGVFGRDTYTPVGYGSSLDDGLMEHPDGALWVHRYKQSALEIVREYFEDEHTQAFMLGLASLTTQPVDRPLTGRLAYSLAYGRQNNSWITLVGGSGGFPDALAKLIEEEGGTVLTNQQVVDLLIEGDRCVGFVSKEKWGDTFVEVVENWQPGFTFFETHYALKEPPLYPIGDERRPCVASIIVESVDNLLRFTSAMRRGIIHRNTPEILAICSTLADETRTPPGGHTLKCISFLPYDLADGGPGKWDEIKEEVSKEKLEYFRKFATNLTDDVILGKHIDSPLDLERRNLHNWRGSGHGGELSPAQSGAMRPVFGWASHRMPIPGLYQTGSTTHPGGSASGGPGRNAAWVILDDLGTSLEAVVAGKRLS